MITAEFLLSRLALLGVKLEVDEGRLRIDAPKGVMTDDLIRDLKNHKTAVISFLDMARSRREPVEITAVPRTRDLPLSYSQRRLYFLEQHRGTGSAYTIASALRLRGRLESDLLEAALVRIVARH